MPGTRRSLLHAGRLSASVLLLAILAGAGCSALVPVRATHYDLHVAIDPPNHRLTATAEVLCALTPPSQQDKDKPVAVEFELNPALRLTDVSADRAKVVSVSRRASAQRPSESTTAQEHPPAVYRVTLDRFTDMLRLTFHYSGQLEQDVQAGEKRGAIHNLTINAHIGEEGTYLDSGGAWYPTPHLSTDESEPESKLASEPKPEALARFRVTIDPVEGYTFVAGADMDTDTANSDTASGTSLTVASRFPQADMVIVGGPYREWSREPDGIRYRILLRDDTGAGAGAGADANANAKILSDRAELFLDAAQGYMQRYEPLMGPYPFDQFTIVENFFSSGFAFPTFTLLGPAVLHMDERSLRHGYLDHEMLHSWWGNSLYVDPQRGNWCEALASYGANYYGFVLDGDDAGARRYRRDVCNMLSRLPAREDRPLATFGREDGAGRGIGYQKGAMVFHMLARVIGEDALWAALRELNDTSIGTAIGWDTIRDVCQRRTGRDLKGFFEQWVYGAGLPQFTLKKAWQAGPGDEHPGRVYVTIQRTGAPFEVELPLRLMNGDGTARDALAVIASAKENVFFDDVIMPAQVVLDPDYQVLRRLGRGERLPTLAGAARGPVCHVLSAPGELWLGYNQFIESLTEHRVAKSVRRVRLSPETVSRPPVTTLAIVGDVVRHPDVQALVEASNCPVRWTENGFEIDGIEYSDPGQAVLVTFPHPDAPEWTVTIYYGNSPEALSNADILWFYGNSLLVFESHMADEGDSAPAPVPVPSAEPPTVIKRLDLENLQQLPVTAPAA